MEHFIRQYDNLKGLLNPGSMDLYLAKVFLIRYVVILLGLVATLQVLDLLSKSDDVLAGEGAQYGDLWRYVTLRAPQLFSLFSPFVALLAAIFSLAGLNVHNEIVIMKAAGWSAFRVILPLILMSALIGAIHFVFNEAVTVGAKKEFIDWSDSDFAADIPPAPNRVDDAWVTDGNNLIKAETAQRSGSVLYLDNVTQYIRDENQKVTALIRADVVAYRNGKWDMFNVKKFDIETLEVIPMQDMPWVTDVPPERFMALALKPDLATLGQLRRAIEQLQKEGHNTNNLKTQLYQKYVAPLSTLLMPLLAGLAAFGLHRGGGLFGRVLFTLAMGFGYFVMDNMFVALGQYGAVTPLIASWLPFVLFGLIGISFILVTEE